MRSKPARFHAGGFCFGARRSPGGNPSVRYSGLGGEEAAAGAKTCPEAPQLVTDRAPACGDPKVIPHLDFSSGNVTDLMTACGRGAR